MSRSSPSPTLWLGAEREELSVDPMRHSAAAPAGAMDALFVHLMLWGRDQGFRWFDLGTAPVADLPLVEFAPSGEPSGLLAVVPSGDGGWTGIDREIASSLAARGATVVGWSSLRDFWSRRTPEAAADLERILAAHAPPGGEARVVLVGYSFGADVLPFLVAGLPAEWREHIGRIVLLGLSETASFEFRLTEWFGHADSADVVVRPELEKLCGLRLLCLYGKSEEDSICRSLPSQIGESAELPGGHHFGGDSAAVAERVLEAIEKAFPRSL